MNTPYEILQKAKEMKRFISVDHTLKSVMENFGDFKEKCPKLFEMVLENKGDYMEELEDMVQKAQMVKSGQITLIDATKVVKSKYDNKYIYPFIGKDSLTHQQKIETEDYILNQQKEAKDIEDKLKQIENTL